MDTISSHDSILLIVLLDTDLLGRELVKEEKVRVRENVQAVISVVTHCLYLFITLQLASKFSLRVNSELWL